ncbi:DUF3558 domain-containing protein [Actinoallomurus acanthiterrae]
MAGRVALAGGGLVVGVFGLVLFLVGCGGTYQRTVVKDPCRLLDRSLVRELTGSDRGTGGAPSPGQWGCDWRSGGGISLTVGVTVFKSRRYGEDVHAARRSYEGMRRQEAGRTRLIPIKNVDGKACWHARPGTMEVLLHRYDVVARVTYTGTRPAANRHVKREQIARLLAENLMHHL